ncbi:hypothetical protein [Deinococcus budaensis]|uniref:Uncharacterized protein n=1 Tax=Deinococcus budaensis TaxID=1665626 RepID=A0A7W8GC40_9DEIO|nr:hypothetical protein [Deinococcus budaensis]MBB5232800.1 hypothetical protein [Deinococcus budaensis]
MSQPSPTRSDVTPPWRSRLAARLLPRLPGSLGGWPGLLTLLSVLAVWLGQQPPVAADAGPRVTAGAQAPVVPELRPAPTPTPGPALLTAPPPAAVWAAPLAPPSPAGAPRWAAPHLPRTLALLGRRQTDGG